MFALYVSFVNKSETTVPLFNCARILAWSAISAARGRGLGPSDPETIFGWTPEFPWRVRTTKRTGIWSACRCRSHGAKHKSVLVNCQDNSPHISPSETLVLLQHIAIRLHQTLLKTELSRMKHFLFKFYIHFCCQTFVFLLVSRPKASFSKLGSLHSPLVAKSKAPGPTGRLCLQLEAAFNLQGSQSCTMSFFDRNNSWTSNSRSAVILNLESLPLVQLQGELVQWSQHAQSGKLQWRRLTKVASWRSETRCCKNVTNCMLATCAWKNAFGGHFWTTCVFGVNDAGCGAVNLEQRLRSDHWQESEWGGATLNRLQTPSPLIPRRKLFAVAWQTPERHTFPISTLRFPPILVFGSHKFVTLLWNRLHQPRRSTVTKSNQKCN